MQIGNSDNLNGINFPPPELLMFCYVISKDKILENSRYDTSVEKVIKLKTVWECS